MAGQSHGAARRPTAASEISAPLREQAAPSKRGGADDFPAVAVEGVVVFVGVARAALRKILKQAAGSGRGVEKQRAGGFAAGVLPGMRDVARHERATAGPADGDLVADLKGDLAGEHPGDLVAVVVEVEEALGAGGQGFLEQHDALVGLTAEELQGKRTAGRRRVEMLPAARGYDKAFCCGHVGLLPCVKARALHSDGPDRKTEAIGLSELRDASRRASANGRSALDQATREWLVGLRGEQAL